MKNLKVAIIGAGFIGKKRADSIKELGQDKIVGVYDIDPARCSALAEYCKVPTFNNLKDLLNIDGLDAVIIATFPKAAVGLVKLALKHKKHVLVEKPLGYNSKDAKEVARLVKSSGKLLKVGFNHRYHPAVSLAHKLFKEGEIGKIMHIRAVYGHGARPGYDLEWRMQKKFSRGGELFDQGVHVIDMAHWFLGDFSKAQAILQNSFWKKSPFEDNAFCLLQTAKGQTAQFHVSITEWKNKFVFEIFGEKGYLFINGLGRSYGAETLTLGQEEKLGRPYKEKQWVFPPEDISWKKEWEDFRAMSLGKKSFEVAAKENIAVMKSLDALYKSGQQHKIITIPNN